MLNILLLKLILNKCLSSLLENIEQNQLAIMNQFQHLMPTINQGNVKDFISISDACKKYHVSHVTINNKIKLFKEVNKRAIDRLQSGGFFLINEAELQEALRIKGSYSKVMNTNKANKEGKKIFHPRLHPKKINPL
jgi:ubiquinone biosynthesis protein Coq4